MSRLSYIFICVILVAGCTFSEKEEQPQSSVPKVEETHDEITEDTTSRAPTKEEVDLMKIAEAFVEENENSLDSIKSVVRNWNIAINVGGFSTFEEIYADNVQFYLKQLSKEEVIASKRTWINKNKNYAQTYDIRQVQYPSSDDELIRVVFDKIMRQNGKIDTILAVLEMRFYDNEYHITKESDQITEIRLANEQRGSQLPEGDYHFDNHRWVDTRDHEVLAHDFVPYYTNMYVTIGDTLDISMSYYSGSLREIRPYKVRNIKYDRSSCILSFDAAMNFAIGWDGEEMPSRLPKDEDYSHFKFKTYPDHITLLEAEYPHKEWEGTHYWSETE